MQMMPSAQDNAPLIDGVEMTEPPVEHLGVCSGDDPPATGSRQDDVNWWRVGCKMLMLVIGFLVLTGLLEIFCDAEVTYLSKTLMGWLGLPGLFVVVLIADGVPQPFTYVPMIFIAVKASVPKLEVFCVCAGASYCAALFGYVAGWNIRKLECSSRLFDRLSSRYPAVAPLMESRGAIGVGLAALLPTPLAIATWTAGSFRVYFPYFAVAGLMRAPKILVFILLSRQGNPHSNAPSPSESRVVVFE